MPTPKTITSKIVVPEWAKKDKYGGNCPVVPSLRNWRKTLRRVK